MHDTQVQHRAERLAARQELGLRGQELERAREVFRALVVESRGLHFFFINASTMRRGVMGDSVISTPSGASASFTAFAIAAGGAIAPPSPMPFCPNRVWGETVSM